MLTDPIISIFTYVLYRSTLGGGRTLYILLARGLGIYNFPISQKGD